MKRIIAVVTGLLCLFVAAGLILPALAKVREFGAMPSEIIGFYTLGVVLTLAGIGTVALSFRKRKNA
ncbi:MAG: hypothetical protein AB9869_19385 [Verrucomicrobiia bacterium]